MAIKLFCIDSIGLFIKSYQITYLYYNTGSPSVCLSVCLTGCMHVCMFVNSSETIGHKVRGQCHLRGQGYLTQYIKNMAHFESYTV